MSDKNKNVNLMLDNLNPLTHVLYESGTVTNPFDDTQNKIIFADDTASGRPCKLVDQWIQESIYPYYSNTHSNAKCGIMMKNMIGKTREIIRHVMKLSDNHKIIFSGNGATGAINHLVNKLDLSKHSKIEIHLTPFEHHSNFLPWKEKADKHDNMKINFINADHNLTLLIDQYLDSLEDTLNQSTDSKSSLDIFSLIRDGEYLFTSSICTYKQ